MRRLGFSGRPAARILIAAAVAAMLPAPGFHRPGAAVAAEGGAELRESVQITVNYVKRRDLEAFDAWIADFRANVDTLIAEGKLSPRDLCAYRTWRVLGPFEQIRELTESRPDTVLKYLFIFDPLVTGASYSLKSHLTTALGEEEAIKRIEDFEALLADEAETFRGDPLAQADVSVRGDDCDP